MVFLPAMHLICTYLPYLHIRDTNLAQIEWYFDRRLDAVKLSF